MAQLIPARQPSRIEGKDGVNSSLVVSTVFDKILEAINLGQLEPGERLNDLELATEFGVSRTPVREALQRLREIGLVEVSASRFTRIAIVSPEETEEALIVWAALYDALIDEIIGRVPAEIVQAMRSDHEHFKAAVAEMDMRAVATANFAFFARPRTLSKNGALGKALVSVVYRIRLGSLHLPRPIDLEALTQVQEIFLDGLERADIDQLHEAMRKVRKIQIPNE